MALNNFSVWPPNTVLCVDRPWCPDISSLWFLGTGSQSILLVPSTPRRNHRQALFLWLQPFAELTGEKPRACCCAGDFGCCSEAAQGCRQPRALVLPSSGAEAPRALLLLAGASRRCSHGAFLAILVALCLNHFSHAEGQGLGRVLFPFVREAEKVSKRVIFYSNSCCGMK